MALNLDFDELMKYSLNCLKINGSYPYYDFNFRWYINLFFQQGIYTCGVILMINSIGKMNVIEEIFEVCFIASFIEIYLICSFKYFVLVNYKLSFRYLIKAVKQDYITAASLPEKEQIIVKVFAMKGNFLTKSWIFLVGVPATLFLIQPCAKMVYYTVTDKFKYVQIAPIVNPAFMQNWNESLAFFSVFGVCVFFVYYSSSLYLGIVPLGPAFLLHASGQLELLKIRMLELFPDDGSVSFQQRTQKLKEIAIRLQSIYDFVDHIGASYKLLYEITMKGTSVIAPILANAAIAAFGSRGEIRVELITLFFGAFALSFYPCYYGDLVNEKSSDLRDAVYMNGWQGFHEKRTRSTLILLMTRMERNVAIRSVFVTIRLATFAGVVHQAYALFNLLHAAL